MRARRIALWAGVVLTAICGVAAIVLTTLAGKHGDSPWALAPSVMATVGSTAVGYVLAKRRPDNPIGWLLIVNGLVMAASGVADGWAQYAALEHPGALPGRDWAVLIEERGWPAIFFSVTAIAFVFPDGHLPSPRWRPAVITTFVSFGAVLACTLLSPDRYSAQYQNIPSPLPDLPEAVIAVPFAVFGIAAVGGLVAAAAAMRARYRRAQTTERLQLKWFAYAAAMVPLIVAICLVENAITGDDGVFTGVALGVVFTGIPVAIGVAVLRYRLYEIDRIVNRTLVYAVLTTGLAATFAVVSLVVGVAVGSGSTLPTAAATLASALLFNPLRQRAQLMVDRRFDRARYEGLRRVERHLEDLRAGRAAPEITGAVLAEAVGDPSLELFFWLPAADAHVDASGVVLESLDDDGRARTPVRRGNFQLATLLHDRALGAHPDLLDSVIEAAGLAIEIGRLRIEVRRQLAEVEASRARIVTAGYEERRRLERDIHDGAQQRLVSIGLSLRHIQAQLPPSGAEARALDATVGEISNAIDELRELARGVRPAGLDDGLAPALRHLASRSQVPTTVDATSERFQDGVETAAYFVASEALANAAKHANASSVTISAERQNGSLVVTVRDDGRGGARAVEGTGLAGLADRVAALGGKLHVDSGDGSGTQIRAELPCAS